MLNYFIVQNQTTQPVQQFTVSYPDTIGLAHFQVMQFQAYSTFIKK